MNKNPIRTAAMGLGLAVICATSSLNAASVTEKITIPFEFRVSKTHLPAGIYRVEQSFGSPLATLVNLSTGQRVQVLRDNSNYKPGAAKLSFESTGEGYSLKRLS